MACKGNEKLTDDFLILIRHPPQCSNMLKVPSHRSLVSSPGCEMKSRADHYQSSVVDE